MKLVPLYNIARFKYDIFVGGKCARKLWYQMNQAELERPDPIDLLNLQASTLYNTQKTFFLDYKQLRIYCTLGEDNTLLHFVPYTKFSKYLPYSTNLQDPNLLLNLSAYPLAAVWLINKLQAKPQVIIWKPYDTKGLEAEIVLEAKNDKVIANGCFTGIKLIDIQESIDLNIEIIKNPSMEKPPRDYGLPTPDHLDKTLMNTKIIKTKTYPFKKFLPALTAEHYHKLKSNIKIELPLSEECLCCPYQKQCFEEKKTYQESKISPYVGISQRRLSFFRSHIHGEPNPNYEEFKQYLRLYRIPLPFPDKNQG